MLDEVDINREGVPVFLGGRRDGGGREIVNKINLVLRLSTLNFKVVLAELGLAHKHKTARSELVFG